MSGTLLGSNPLVQLGSLNRLRGSLQFPNFPQYNIIAAYVGREGFDLTIQGETTQYLDQLAGAVTSPEPFQQIELTVHLVRTLALAQSFQQVQLTNSLLGDMTFRTDASPPSVSIYQFSNCSVKNVRALKANGTDASYSVMFGGVWYINANLFT